MPSNRDEDSLFSSLSLEASARDRDNEDDGIYDNWREFYGISAQPIQPLTELGEGRADA